MNKNNVIALCIALVSLLAMMFIPASLYSTHTAIIDIPEITPYGDLVHSSVDPDGNLRFFWQDYTFGVVPFDFYYRIDDGDWGLAPAGDIDNASALVPYMFGDYLRYRLSTKVSLPDPVGEVGYVQAAYIDGYPVVPPMGQMARVAEDAVGDSVMVYEPYYDLTDLHMAVNDYTLYTCISNASNTFPTMNSFTSYNLYALLMGNENLFGGAVYAMIYTQSVPGVISPGLYRIEIDLDFESIPNFERLGDVSAQVSDGKLHMSCDISDLAAHVGPDGWPAPGSDLLFMGAISLNLTIDFATFEPDFAVGDILNGGIVEFTDNSYYHFANSLPVLSNATNYDHVLTVDYFDPNGDYPLVMEYVFADGSSLAMEEGDMIGQNRRFTVQSPDNFAGGYINCSDNLTDYVTLDFNEVSNEDELIPMAELKIVAPNPMRGGAMQKIEVKTQADGITELYLYDLRGRKLGKMFSGYAENGGISFDWDCSMDGKALGSGVYFIKAETGGKSSLRRTMILK